MKMADGPTFKLLSWTIFKKILVPFALMTAVPFWLYNHEIVIMCP